MALDSTGLGEEIVADHCNVIRHDEIRDFVQAMFG